MSDTSMNEANQAPGPPVPGELAKPEPTELGRQWARTLTAARKHWEKLHKRIEHNRKLVAGFNWQQDPTSGRFIDPRANLIFSTVQATLPNIYARNPDVSVTGNWKNSDTKLFCETLQTVLSRQTRRANLKRRAKMSVIAALVSYMGVLKVTYQRDMEEDALIAERIPDTQDNILALDEGVRLVEDPQARDLAELHTEQLREIIEGVDEQSEVVAAEGLVIDRVLTENLLIDPSVCEFYDYEHADWLAQCVPMKRGAAQARFKVDLSGAKVFKPDGLGGVPMPGEAQPLAFDAQAGGKASDDDMICVIEIWDRVAQRVHTMADGCEFFVRDSYSPPRAGNRWYPFFLLPYAVLDGQFVAPCLVDLTEKLQDEHNSTRDKFAAHRELNRPGWIASADTNMKTLTRHVDALLGEVVLIDAEGRPINQVIVGGINAATATWWRNFANTGINTATRGNVSDAMNAAWRHCIRNGGAPDFILAGTAFCDAYAADITLTQNTEAGKAKTVDLGIGTGGKTGLFFKGVEIIWDPVFEVLDALETPAVPWEKRAYLLNMRHLGYRDNDMNIVKPTRPHDVLALYLMVILRMALTTNRRNAHAVLAIQ